MDETFLNWATNELGRADTVEKEIHGDQSTVYIISTANAKYFLKVADDLTAEHKRLRWLKGKLPVPNAFSFMSAENKDALLLSAIEGKNLATLKKEWPVEKVVDKLAEALRLFHATPIRSCPFGSPGRGKVLVHGDACLSNLMFHNDTLSGYIDLGDARVDNPDVDLAAAVWSLQYNLGPGYGMLFLKKYGIKNPTEELVEKLRLQYEEARKKWIPREPKIYFITGVCGIGKTAILTELKRKLQKEVYDFHDLDERGHKSTEGWRLGELNYFKKQAEENLKKDITTFISGFSRPTEIFNSTEKSDNSKIILLHADPETIKKRILGRYSMDKEKKAFFKKHRETVEKFADDNAAYAETFKKIVEPYRPLVIETSNLSPESVAQEIINKELFP